MTNEQFFDYGWRIPFIASAVLVVVGFYIRLKITETPAFLSSLETNQKVQIPLLTLLKSYRRELVFGTLAAVTTFLTFYLLTVFSLSWVGTDLGYARRDLLIMQLFSVFFFGISIPISALLADRFGRRLVLIVFSVAIALFGFTFSLLLGSGNATLITLFLCLGMTLMGLTYGPLGTYLSELFPTHLRYSGASITFNSAGIIGAAFAPIIAIWLAKNYGIGFVGYYLSVAALISFVAFLTIRKKEEVF
jgi:MFS family permease